MGFFSNLIAEWRTNPAADIDWGGIFGRGIETAAGVSITNQNSLQTSAVFACARVLSESVASLPLVTYRRRPGGRGRDRATDHYLYPILHDLANPEMTAYELRETLMGHVVTWGNGYSEIEFNRAGEVAALWPLRPDRMKVSRVNKRIRYVYQMPEGSSTLPYVELPFERVMHIRGLGYDGLVGYDPIAMARQSIGLARGTEAFGARFFGNGAQTGAVYEHPGKLSDTAYNRLVRSIEKRHQGLENAHRIMILEEGMKGNQVGIPPENAQFLETRKFQVSEISRWFRVPPHMIADLDRASFNNIEHLSLEFVIFTLMPWFVRWEQAISRDLLTPRERLEYFAEHLVNALLRGDIKTRYEAYAIGRQWGWLSTNDIREKENDNPVEGGDVYLVPLNMIPADQVGQVTSTDTGLDGGNRSFGPPLIPPREGEERDAAYEARALNMVVARQRLARSWQRVFSEAIGRVVKREIVDVRRAIKKYFGKRDAQEFGLWLQEFYREHKDFWRKQMLPVLLAYADQVGVSVAEELGGELYSNEEIRQFIDDYVTALAKREAGSSHLQLQALLDQALQDSQDPEPVLTERLDEWEEKRTDKVTASESFNALNAFVVAFYGLAGVRRLIWRAVGKNCPYCRHLDGHVIEIEKFFVEKDTDFQPEGAEQPLSKRHSVRHPPLHGGCDCCVTAG